MRLFILHFISLIQIGCMPLHTHIAKYASLTQPVTQIMKPFSHFRLAEADKKKRNKPFLTKVTQAATTDHNLPSPRERKLLQIFSEKQLGNFSTDLTEAQEFPNLNFSKPWTKETNGTVFQSVSVCVSVCDNVREREKA